MTVNVKRTGRNWTKITQIALLAVVVVSAHGAVGAADDPGDAAGEQGILAPVTFPFDLGSIPAGATVTLEFDVDVDNPLTSFPAFVVTNQGAVSGVGVPPVVTDDPATGTVGDPTLTVLDTADLVLVKDDSPDPVAAGGLLQYFLTVSNNGPQIAENVVVTDTLPPGVTFVSTSGCAEDPVGVPICTLGNLAVGSSAGYVIDVTVDPSTVGPIVNNAVASSLTAEAVPGNEAAAETTTVTAEADLSITKIDDIDPVNAGTTLNYTISVANAGPSDATNVVVTDTLPAGVTFVASTGCAEDPNGVPTCSLGTIAAGGSAQYTIEVSVDGTTEGTITNTASVASDASDPAPGNNTVTEDTFVLAVADLDLAVMGSVDPVTAGETMTLGFDVDNLGPGDAQDVTAFSVLADDTSYVTDTLGACAQPLDLHGFVAELDGSQVVPPVATAATGVVAFAMDEGTGELWFSIHIEEIVPPNEVIAAHIHSGAAGANGPVVQTLYAGTPPVFDPANPIVGTIQLTPVEVTDLLTGDHYVNVHTIDNPAGEVRGQMALTLQTPVRCTVGTIVAATDALFDIEIAVAPDVVPAAEFDSLAMVFSSTSDPDEVALPAPNGTGLLHGATARVNTTVTTSADLVISKTDSVDPVVAGTALTYTVQVGNNGPSDAADVVVTDTLPAGVSFVATTGCAEDPNGVAICTLGTIPAGGSASYTIDVLVDAGTAGIITNAASVASSTPEAAPGDEDTTEDTAVDAVADLSIAKTDTVDPVTAGTDLGYALVASNAGPSDDLATVTVTDTLPAGVTFVSAAGAGWTCSEAAGVVTCTRVGLAIGAAPVIDLVVGVNPETRGMLNNVAVVGSPTTDPNAANDTTAEGTTVVAEADLGLTKEASVEPLPPGDPLVYTLTVTNDGPSSATDVVVTDTLPAGVTLVSTAGCAEDPVAVPLCTLGSVAAGGSAQYTITVTVDPGPPPTITNTASVTGLETDPDPTNNEDSVVTTLDAEPPTVTQLTTIVDTGDGWLDECETATVEIHTFLWSFSEELFDPPGDTDPDDVTNPDNYRVLAPGADHNYATDICGPVLGDDVPMPIPTVVYDLATDTSTVSVGGTLPPSLYRVMACGSTSIVDRAGNPLDGTGNGVGGDDYVLTFRADPFNALANGHFDCDLADWTLTSATPGEIIFSPDDADGSDLSGSVAVTNLGVNTDFAVSQCAAVPAGIELAVTGRMRFDADPLVAASFSRECIFYPDPGCAGVSLGSNVVTVLAGDTGGAWVPFHGTIVPAAGAVSTDCIFRISNPEGADFTAWFDQLFLDNGSRLFSNGFESGDTSAWSVVQGE